MLRRNPGQPFQQVAQVLAGTGVGVVDEEPAVEEDAHCSMQNAECGMRNGSGCPDCILHSAFFIPHWSGRIHSMISNLARLAARRLRPTLSKATTTSSSPPTSRLSMTSPSPHEGWLTRIPV